MRTFNGAEVLCHALMEEGVEVLFGYPGGAILPFYDALYRTPSIRHILVRHEQAAAHAADGFARATGRVGVVVATSGPGATNLVTGLATAMADSVPMVAITGQVPLGAMGSEAFQETDTLGTTMSVTKHGFLVEDPDDLPAVVSAAFRIAEEGRPGPVLIDVPKDVQARESQAFPLGRRGDQGRFPLPSPTGGWSDALLEEAVRLLNEAERPLVMVGRGVVLSGTESTVMEMVERADLPVSTTLLGLDAFSPSHPLALGMPGMHGTERANQAIQASDVILGLGLRFDDRVTGPVGTFAPGARIIHLDIDPSIPGRTVRPRIRVVGNLRESLPPLAARILPRSRPEWWTRLGNWSREAEPNSWEVDPRGLLKGRKASKALAERIRASGALVTTDVGQHQMWLAQEFRSGVPGTHLTSGGLGTMGYALPAAIGAALGRPDKPVWVVAGDGGFQMNVQELATVVQEGLPLKMAVVNNAALGMVRQWQDLFYDKRYSASKMPGPDLVALAAAYGIPARRVTRNDELDGALDEAESRNGPCLLDLRIAPEDMVFPLVPPGAGLEEMIRSHSKEEAK